MHTLTTEKQLFQHMIAMKESTESLRFRYVKLNLGAFDYFEHNQKQICSSVDSVSQFVQKNEVLYVMRLTNMFTWNKFSMHKICETSAAKMVSNPKYLCCAQKSNLTRVLNKHSNRLSVVYNLGNLVGDVSTCQVLLDALYFYVFDANIFCRLEIDKGVLLLSSKILILNFDLWTPQFSVKMTHVDILQVQRFGDLKQVHRAFDRFVPDNSSARQAHVHTDARINLSVSYEEVELPVLVSELPDAGSEKVHFLARVCDTETVFFSKQAYLKICAEFASSKYELNVKLGSRPAVQSCPVNSRKLYVLLSLDLARQQAKYQLIWSNAMLEIKQVR